jgi:hypothetical protein
MLTQTMLNALFFPETERESYGTGHTIISIHTKALFTSIIDIRVIYLLRCLIDKHYTYTQVSDKMTSAIWFFHQVKKNCLYEYTFCNTRRMDLDTQ